MYEKPTLRVKNVVNDGFIMHLRRNQRFIMFSPITLRTLSHIPKVFTPINHMTVMGFVHSLRKFNNIVVMVISNHPRTFFTV